MQARAGALNVRWLPVGNRAGADFQFVGLPPNLQPAQAWLSPEVRAEVIGAKALTLGPEPVIGAQRVVLRLDERQVVIATDGLGPFQVLADEAAP